ncbi:hypothetical protein D4R30_00230 [archaeon]|nr:MAG: hypothetical protein D4R30_00230 [archaeon]
MDPYLAYKEGGLMAVAVILFIANFVQNYSIRKSNEALLDAITQSNAGGVSANQAVSLKLTDLTQALAVGQDLLSQALAAVAKNQEVLAAHQTNLIHTNNDIVRELITIIRDGERG